MEWFWMMMERLNKSAMVLALQSFQPIDWIFLFAMLWGLARGSRKGFSVMFGKFWGLLFVSMATLILFKPGAAILTSTISGLPERLGEAFAFVLLAVILGFSIAWAINALEKVLKVEAQGLLKTVGGMVLGGMHMLLLLSFTAQFLLFIPNDTVQNAFKPGKSYAGYTVARVLPDVTRLLVSPFLKSGSKNAVATPKTGA